MVAAVPERDLAAHGGPDALGVPRFDFSTNSNSGGPCPLAWAAVQQADASRYPDPNYTALRALLANFHAVQVDRVLLGASASEFIHRISAWVARQGGQTVALPAYHYGDYARAAQAWGLRPVSTSAHAALLWACEPCSPRGQAQPGLADWVRDLQPHQTLALDRAYAPLRLRGRCSLQESGLDRVWQLFTPNKALGLTGVRAAYAIAPRDALLPGPGGQASAVQALMRLAPSWPLGVHGVALLQAWVQADVQAWLADSLGVLRDRKAQQIAMLQGLGWQVQPSEANYFCARPALPAGVDWLAWLAHLRTWGIKLRDATSFGLSGWVRLGVLAPQAQDALRVALFMDQGRVDKPTRFEVDEMNHTSLGMSP